MDETSLPRGDYGLLQLTKREHSAVEVIRNTAAISVIDKLFSLFVKLTRH